MGLQLKLLKSYKWNPFFINLISTGRWFVVDSCFFLYSGNSNNSYVRLANSRITFSIHQAKNSAPFPFTREGYSQEMKGKMYIYCWIMPKNEMVRICLRGDDYLLWVKLILVVVRKFVTTKTASTQSTMEPE